MNTILKLAACIAATIAIWGFALASRDTGAVLRAKNLPRRLERASPVPGKVK